MIKDKPKLHFSPWLSRGFEMVFDIWMKFKIGDLYFKGLDQNIPLHQPILMFANHCSNWDGFLLRAVQKRLAPNAPLYSIMLEEELQRYPVFRKLGGIGINPQNGSYIRFALSALKEECEKKNLFFLSYFPQGKIWPAYKRPLGFNPGISLFAEILAPITLLPIAIHMEPMGKLSPSYFISIGKPILIEYRPLINDLQNIIEDQLNEIQSTLCEYGEKLSPLFQSKSEIFTEKNK